MSRKPKQTKAGPHHAPHPDPKGSERYLWNGSREKNLITKVQFIRQLSVIEFARLARGALVKGVQIEQAFAETLSLVQQASEFLDGVVKEAEAEIADMNLPVGERIRKFSAFTTKLYWIPRTSALKSGRFNPMREYNGIPVLPFSKVKERVRFERIRMPQAAETFVTQTRQFIAALGRMKVRLESPVEKPSLGNWKPSRRHGVTTHWAKRTYQRWHFTKDGSLYELDQPTFKLLLLYLKQRNGMAEGSKTRGASGTGHQKAWESCLARIKGSSRNHRKDVLGRDGKDSSCTTPM